MLIYFAEGGVEERRLDRTVTLKDLQTAVGGYIELVPRSGEVTHGGAAYCNEDGLRLGLPFNGLASLRFRQNLVGNVVELDAAEHAATEADGEDDDEADEGDEAGE